MSTVVAQKIYDNLLDMKKSIQKADSLALQLLKHPDASANQVMEVQQMLVRSHQGYRRLFDSFMKLPGIHHLGPMRDLNRLK